jgi:hypothetical protein
MPFYIDCDKAFLLTCWYIGASVSFAIFAIMVHAFYFHYSRSDCNWHNFFIDRTCTDTDLYQVWNIVIIYSAFLFFFTCFLIRAMDYTQL